MPTWNPGQYLKFNDERTQPCRDLVARIALENPRQIVDLGCGPGNSTVILSGRWPEAKITGIDSSAEMIETARKNHSHIQWQEADIDGWKSAAPVDLIFSNAAFHWVEDLARVIPHLFTQVVPGGAIAWQVPANLDAPAHHLMRVVAGSLAWRPYFPDSVREWHAHPPAYYYDLLKPQAARIDLWQTEYIHVLDRPAAIVEWYKGTGLRPFLDRLPDAATRDRFLADYLGEIEKVFRPQEDGHVLFPFLRQFVIAYRH